ncbi:carbohydrate ABC transporter permease [Chloroflexi bacterium TSY]|nr:carbohydrate ABC transporter permease [Chloroflexi bacterium TSY]
MNITRYDTGLASRIFDACNTLFLIGVVFATLYPLYYIGIVSLSNGNAVLRGDVSFWPVGFTLESYELVLADPAIIRSLLNSILYTTVGTAINLFCTAICAYPISRPNFSGKTVCTWIITITMFFSGGLIPLYLVVLQLGLTNTMWALVLPFAISPWFVFIMRTNFQGIHEHIFDAATIDGANDFQILNRIVLPLSKPILATLLLFYAVDHWNEFFNALIFLDDKAKFPLQLIMRAVVILGSFEQTNEINAATDFMVIEKTLKFATIMVSTLPILVVYPFVQRYFVQGVMIGGVKG